MLEIYIAGKDYYTRFAGHPDTVLPIRWYRSRGEWRTQSRPMPESVQKTTLEALPPDLQEQIRTYQTRWTQLRSGQEPFQDSSLD